MMYCTKTSCLGSEKSVDRGKSLAYSHPFLSKLVHETYVILPILLKLDRYSLIPRDSLNVKGEKMPSILTIQRYQQESTQIRLANYYYYFSLVTAGSESFILRSYFCTTLHENLA